MVGVWGWDSESWYSGSSGKGESRGSERLGISVLTTPVSSSLKCSNCYMVWGGDFVSPGQQGRISHTDLVIGCLVDLATGLMTFTANGKESNTFFQVSPAPQQLSNSILVTYHPRTVHQEDRPQGDRTKTTSQQARAVLWLWEVPGRPSADIQKEGDRAEP